MGNYRITADYKSRTAKHIVTLSLISFKEEDTCIIYSPALDLSGYGKNEAEAKKSFAITLHQFLLYADHKNTIFVELEKHGWRIYGSKRKPKVEAPSFSKMLENNKEFNTIVNKKPFKQILQEVEI